ncbi:MAG: (d)CMP kinase [Ignavibacteriaceae bacterium]|nr:(d)CMP kinase [Ignavibacteriaceae bacterium]
MKKRLIIAIDGPAGSGKSSTAKKLAGLLGYNYIDTGAMYRAFCLFLLKNNLLDEISHGISLFLERDLKLIFEKGNIRVFLDGEDISDLIRTPEVSGLTSRISTVGEVREVMVEMQRKLGASGGVVLDGRDIGTVVFPSADFKFYMTASPEERVRRRILELQEKGMEFDPEETRRSVIERDIRDSSRDIAPMKKADDAIEIDTTGLTLDEQVNKMYDIIAGN